MQSVVVRMIEDVVVGEIEIGIERGGVVLEADQIRDRRVGGEVAGTQRSNSNCIFIIYFTISYRVERDFQQTNNCPTQAI